MDRQPASMHNMHNMHNTFWLENQLIVTFFSGTPLIGPDGVNNGQPILQQLDLQSQLQKLNEFLKENNLNFTLSFYNDNESLQEPTASQVPSPKEAQRANDFNQPPGVYMFGFSTPLRSTFGKISTSIVSFFNFKGDSTKGGPSSIAGMSFDAGTSSKLGKAHDDDDEHEDHDEDDEKDRRPRIGPVPTIVNLLNSNLEQLNNERKIPISAAAPNWTLGATSTTGPIAQGCPLTPPIPVKDSCSNWHITLPNLSPKELQSMTGEGVTVFVLDTLPDREVISRAATKAGDDNLLLSDVNSIVTFNYSIKSHAQHVPGAHLLTTAKDIYGRHTDFKMSDHGLFIAGVIHDIAPKASIECIRVLNEHCVGDLDMLAQALRYIADRMSPSGDLYQKPVVINLSLVIPTQEEAKSKGVNPDLTAGPNNDIETCLRLPMKSLVELGAVFAASVGNEGDLRGNPSGGHPMALLPAAFVYSPYYDKGIIPVGAVNAKRQAASYSCYPGSRGVATYGGEIPTVKPKNPPSNHPIVTVSDALRGIYSSTHYPPLSKDHPALEYDPPNDHAWAYWVGTSFATPIISAVAARVLELKSTGVSIPDVPQAVINAAGPSQITWAELDPATTGVSSGSATGPMILAVQECVSVDDADEKQEEKRKTRRK